MKINDKNKKTLINYGIFAISILITLLPAIYNGFPFYFYDLADYICTVFNKYLGVFRPIGYGYFLRATSFNQSLWLVVITQVIIGNYLILRLTKIFFQKNVNYLYLFFILALSLTSSFSWFSSFLMPDIFIGFGFIALFIIVFEKSDWIDKLMPAMLLVVSSFVHTSHPPVLFVVAMSLALLSFLLEKREQKIILRASLVAIALIFSSVILIKLSNKPFNFAYNHASYAFIMSRLEETGILKDFLDKNCKTKQYDICSLYPNFQKKSPEGFLWDKESPIWIKGWLAAKDEYSLIIKEVFSQKNYAWRFIKDGIITGLVSTQKIDIDDFDAQERERHETYYPAIQEFFPDDIKTLKESRQFQAEDKLRAGMLPIFQFTIIISLLAIILLYKTTDNDKKIFVITVFVVILTNAVLTGILSTAPSCRYTARIAWLIPLTALILSGDYFLKKENTFKK